MCGWRLAGGGIRKRLAGGSVLRGAAYVFLSRLCDSLYIFWYITVFMIPLITVYAVEEKLW